MLGPTLARPSESRITRLTRSFSKKRRTCFAPRTTPAWSAVLPPGWMRWMRAFSSSRWSRLPTRSRSDQQFGFVIVGDERKEIVVAQLVDRHRGRLPRFLEFRAGHGTAAIEDDREIHRRTPRVFVFASFDLDLHDDFARAEPVNKIAFRRDAQGHIRRG